MKKKTGARRLRIRLWLGRLPAWKCEKRRPEPEASDEFYRRPYYWLAIERDDGVHWNPFIGRSLESAAGKMLAAHGVTLDGRGAEVNDPPG